MDTQTIANGSGPAGDGMSNAEKLMAQHTSEESHKVTVEDVSQLRCASFIKVSPVL